MLKNGLSKNVMPTDQMPNTKTDFFHGLMSAIITVNGYRHVLKKMAMHYVSSARPAVQYDYIEFGWI